MMQAVYYMQTMHTHVYDTGYLQWLHKIILKIPSMLKMELI